MPTEVMTKTCRRCNGELSYDEERECWECLSCYPKNRVQAAPQKEEKKYVDVAMTEAKVREIVRDELENWHIQKPSVPKTEISKLTATEVAAHQNLDPIPNKVVLDWRAQAKELGIELFHRTKADVEEEIVTRTSGEPKTSPNGDNI